MKQIKQYYRRNSSFLFSHFI